jgi:7,8-dihydropterin-6-yl-methyl-4-(beta-D-ribofuranosyl)aminobenzene 5'-phosphate synthase
MQRTILLSLIVLLSACQQIRPTEPTQDLEFQGSTPKVSQIPTQTPFLPQSTVPHDVMGKTEAEMSDSLETDTLVVKIVYDNNEGDPRLTTAWGFSALVEYKGETLLFDTGGDVSILLGNMDLLEIDPEKTGSIVISHAHNDHTGGLLGILAESGYLKVFFPPSVAPSFAGRIAGYAETVAVTPGQSISEAIFTTGEMGGSIPEQAIAIKTPKGSVIITGCAHPGVVQMVERAKALLGGEVYLVLGGFHLGSKSVSALESIIQEFRRLGVEKVAPCHCTGDSAIQMFKDEYGDDFIRAGVGTVILVEP